MIIVNADDWGKTRTDTDSALFCYNKGRITSVSAMVFMEDSRRAAELAKKTGIDVGLHLNLTQRFSKKISDNLLQKYHNDILNYLTLNKYVFLFYNPFLDQQFRYLYQAQLHEFLRLYEKPPSHINGHHHMHLCANMLLRGIIPKNEKVRRNFSFWLGEKCILNITYRRIIDKWLSARYFITDYFFALSGLIETDHMSHAFELAKNSTVEIEAHPADSRDHAFLMSDEYLAMLNSLEKGTYASI